MSFLSVLFVAIALSMDSFAVSIALGLGCCSTELKHILRVVLFLSVAQATFALLGWLVGDSCLEYIKNYDHWLAFILLSVIGGQMVYEGIKGKNKDSNDNNNAVPTVKSLLLLSIATSIDALITGVSFAFLDVDIFMVIVVILSVTAFFTFIGFTFSGKIGKKCGNYSEIFGGIVLILIGLKVLIEHTLLA